MLYFSNLDEMRRIANVAWVLQWHRRGILHLISLYFLHQKNSEHPADSSKQFFQRLAAIPRVPPGMCFFCGGLNYQTQRFNANGARTQYSLLLLAILALVIPTVVLLTGVRPESELLISRGCAAWQKPNWKLEVDWRCPCQGHCVGRSLHLLLSLPVGDPQGPILVAWSSWCSATDLETCFSNWWQAWQCFLVVNRHRSMGEPHGMKW